MIRILLIALISFVLPFVIYAISQTYFVTNKEAPKNSMWESAPYPFLSAMGALLAMGSIVMLVLWSEGKL